MTDIVRAAKDASANRWLLIAAFGAIYLIWGSTYLALKVSVATISPFVVIAFRTLVAGSTLLYLAYRKEKLWPNREQLKNGAISGIMLFLGGHTSLAWAEQTVDSGVAALVVATVPLWILIFEWLGPNKTVPRITQVLGLVTGFAGIMLISGFARGSSVGNIDQAGVVALLFSAMMWSAGSIWQRYHTQPDSPMMGAGLQLVSGGLAVLIIALLRGDVSDFQFGAMDSKSFAALLYMTIFGSLIGFSAYNWLMGKVSPVLVSTYSYVNPLLALFIGATLAHEVLTSDIKIAAIMIIGSVVLIAMPKWKARPKLAAQECSSG